MSHSDHALAVVLAISEGRELLPLTANRATSAVPFGGIYRTIDFTLTNCLHSGLRRILVMSQYKSHSLHKHLRDGWSIFNPEIGEFVTPIPPQIIGDRFGYGGSAEALQQNMYLLERNHANVVMILCGTDIYRMDYAAMIEFHRRQDADVTVAYLPEDFPDSDPALPLLDIGDDEQIREIAPGRKGTRPASMGVYAFSKRVLLEALDSRPAGSWGAAGVGDELLASLLGRARVLAYRFGGAEGRVSQDRYWRRMSSLDIYYQSNMDLLRHETPLDLYQADWPIRTYQPQSPPARTVPGNSCNEGIFVNSIVASGTVIAGGGVNHSILCARTFIDDAATVENAILLSGVQVGEGAELRNCIIDKHVVIPPGEKIGVDAKRDRERFMVTDNGIAVVPKNYAFHA